MIVGVITNNVMNSARPTSTWFGGVCWVPMAVRRIDKVMMMRVKPVVTNNNDGKSVNAVIRMRVCNVKDRVCPPPACDCTCNSGRSNPDDWAAAMFVDAAATAQARTRQ